MTLADISDQATQWWLGTIVLPLGYWLNKKRKEYARLEQRVDLLESKLDATNDKIDEKFDAVHEKIDEDRVERKHTADTINKIYDILYKVKEDTAVNSSKLNK